MAGRAGCWSAGTPGRRTASRSPRDALQAGIASLEAHEEYLAGLPGHPAPKDMLPMIASMQGRAMGVEHAVLFRAYDLQAPPPLLD